MIFDFMAYRSYLESRLGRRGQRTGLRKKLAESISVHTTFVSQVLLGKADFSLEQGEQVNQFLEHTDDEGEYFLYLIMIERAGNSSLKSRFEKKAEEIRQGRLNIRDRLEVATEISQEDKIKFYSNSYYGAIHVLSSIPAFQNVEALSNGLKLPRVRVQEMVDFLLRLGVVIIEQGALGPGPKHIHLGADTDLVLKHHSNWRMNAINSLNFVRKEDLHYSACLTISQKDAFRVKESILENLKSNVDIVSKSPEEVAYVYNIDFYSLLGD